MKIALVVAASAVALMSGCATTTTPTASAPPQAASAYDDNIDYAYVAAVNNAAKGQGVLIKWINYPEKRKKGAVGVAPAQPEPTGT